MDSLVIDVRANGNTGVARYGHRLLIEARHDVERLADKVYAVARARDLDLLRPRLASSAIEVVTSPLEDESRYLRADPWLADFVAGIRPDLYYTTNYLIDERHDCPFVFTIHDLIRLVLPGASSDTEFIARYGEQEYRTLRRHALAQGVRPARDGGVFGPHFEARTRELAHHAVRIATVSAASAADIVSLLGVDPSRISIVPSAVDEAFHPRPGPPATEIRHRFALRGPYFVYVGLAGSHKRVDWLIRQFAVAAPQCPPGTRLVIVGGDAEQRADIGRAAAEAGLPDGLVFTGRITDDDIAALYTGAAAYLSGALKEGFGLPPAEAMACGSEAIVTDIPAHREVLGGHAHYYDTQDGGRFRDLVVAAARGRLTRRSPGYPPPTWPVAAAAFIGSLRRALESA